MRRDEAISCLKAAEHYPGAGSRRLVSVRLCCTRRRERRFHVDLFIDPDPARPFGFTEFMDVSELLRQRLGTEIGYTTREGLHHRLRPEIEKTAIRIF